jgi:HK97 family phage portal protein
MGRISGFRQRIGSWIKGERRSGTSSPEQWLIDWVNGGSESSSGVNVSESNALRYSPFWSAVRVISGTCASLPLIVYRASESGRERATTHKAYPLLHDAPNDYMDAVTFIETRMAHALTYGNGYAEIQTDGGGRPIALWPLLPDRTSRGISPSGIPYYQVRLDKGETVYLADDAVLHIKGLGYDGYTGYNVVQHHKDTIGYGVASKEYGARFFANDASPGGILEHPGQLSDKAAKHLADSWNAQHQGMSKKHRLAVLEEGMKWVQTGVSPVDAQSLEVQKYTVDDCARIFNIPPHKIGSMDRATFSNIEEQNLDFVTQTMYYWFRKWEQELNRKMFLPGERGKFYVEFLVDGLLRGNMTSRYNAYSLGRQWGWLSVNDIRDKENMNSVGKVGDAYLMPLNMLPVGPGASAIKMPEPKPSPAPASTPTKDGPADTAPGGPPPKSLSKAHMDLLASQWRRVIRKQVNAIEKGVNHSFWTSHRAFAFDVLSDTVRACGSIVGLDADMSDQALAFVIDTFVRSDVTLVEDDDAVRLAASVAAKLGA